MLTSKERATLHTLPRSQQMEIARKLNLPLLSELANLSVGASIPIIAELPSANQTSGRLADGDPVSAYLQRVNGGNAVPQVMVKWRDGALIARTPVWFQHSAAYIPWGTTVELRRMAGEGIKLPRY